MPNVGTSPEVLVSGFELATTQTRGRETTRGFVLLVAVSLAAAANFDLVWNQFYRGIPVLFDAAWYAYLIHHSTPLLANPPAVAFATIGQYFYSTHFSPALWMLSWPSYLVPVGPQVWLGCAMAFEHALLAALTWFAVRRFAPGATGWPGVAAAAIVVLAPFSGVELACMIYPHFESWFVVLALGFLGTLFLRRTRLAVVPFALALFLREDMGFHLCGVLVLTTLAARIVRGQWDGEMKTWLGFAAAGFAWSCAAIVAMKIFFPGDDAFARVYLGDPPLAHWNWDEFAERFRTDAKARGFIWMPLLVYLAWGAVNRCWWVLIGYLAFVPWMVVNSLARSRAAGTLGLYYSFPLGLALLWPLVGQLVFGRSGAESGNRSRVVWVATALFVSVAGFVPDDGWRSFAGMMTRLPVPGVETTLHYTATRLARAATAGQPVGIDAAVAALAPGDFRAANLFGQAPAKVSLSAFYANGPSTRFEWDVTRDLPLHYAVQDSNLLVLSAEPLDWPGLDLVSPRAGSIVSFLRVPPPATTEPFRKPEPGMRFLCAGPAHWYFRVGETWKVSFMLAAGADADVTCDVVTHQGRVVLGHAVAKLSGAPGGVRRTTRELSFVIPPDQDAGIEFGVQAPRDATVQVEDVTLMRRTRAPDDPEAGRENRREISAR